MSFPRYPSYKDSGVEWLGEVPRHWEVTRARNHGVFSGSGIDKKTVEGEQPVKMFNYLDVYNSIDKTLPYSPDLMDTTAPADKAIEHAVRRGDILLTPSSETSDDVGHAARVLDVPEGVVYSYHILRFRGTDAADPAFLTYAFNAAPTRAYFTSVCTGTTRMVLGREDFKSAPVAKPPPAEQTQIAAFLDRETAKIDDLVAEQRRLMELLKEKRQAVISHAVTKGLNPHAPMKPSGIEWLGNVPTHWKITRLAYNAVIENGTTPSRDNPEYWFDGDIPWLSSGEVNQYRITEAKEFITKSALEKCSLRLLPKGTIVIGMIGQGKTRGLSASLEIEASINQNLAAIIPGKNLASDYLLYIFQSVYEYLREFGRGGNQAALNCEILSALKVPLPPLEEQLHICVHLAAHLKKFDNLTTEAQRAIDLLQERRTALISDAVTGQIDVRQFTKQEAA